MTGLDRHLLGASEYATSAIGPTDGELAQKVMATARLFEESPAMRSLRKGAASTMATSRLFEESPVMRSLRKGAASAMATSRLFEESPVMRSLRNGAASAMATSRLFEESVVMRSFRESAHSTMASMQAFAEGDVMSRFRHAGEVARAFAESDVMKSIRAAESAVRTFATSEAAKRLWEIPEHTWEVLETDGENNPSPEEVQDENAAALGQGKLIIESISHSVLALLRKSPEAIHLMPPERLEELVFERFHALGFNVERAGATNTPDGGVDLVACPKNAGPLPYLVAVQVKHKRGGKGSIGGPVVREFAGAMLTLGFKAGMVVTNASFTPDAEWVAKQREGFLQLRDMEDLKKWMRDDFGREVLWLALPDRIEVRPGFWVRVPKPNP